MHPLKNNQLSGVGSGVAEQRVQRGPPAQGSVHSTLPDLWQQKVGPIRPAREDRALLSRPPEGHGTPTDQLAPS
jgi:hypothetical protein